MRNNKGVTLVALVITIIVLIILAAVSLATLTGDNNIFTRAEQAKEDTNYNQAFDEINTALLSIKTEAAAGYAGGTQMTAATAKSTAEAILGSGYTVAIDTTNTNLVTITKSNVVKNGTTYTISGSIDVTGYGTITAAAAEAAE